MPISAPYFLNTKSFGLLELFVISNPGVFVDTEFPPQPNPTTFALLKSTVPLNDATCYTMSFQALN